MPELYAQEPAETYGAQISVENLLNFPYVRLGQKIIEAIPAIGRDAFVTYCALLHYADRGGQCWPTYESLMHVTTFGRKKLMKSLKVLCDHKLLKRAQMRRGKQYGANRYSLLPLEDWSPSAAPVVPNRHHQAWSEPSMVVPTLDRSALDRSERHHKLDPVLTRSSFKLEEKSEERAREDVQSGEESAEEAESRLGGQSLCDYPDPNGWACPHETAALIGLTEILERPVKKSHRNLHAFVHSHSLAETLDVARHFTQHETERSKWTLGLMYAADNAEARLAAVRAPASGKSKTSPQHERPAAHRAFERDEPTEPPDDVATPEEARAHMAEISKLINSKQWDMD